MGYIVKFTNLEENTRDAFSYTHLWDALSVAKNTLIGSDRIHRPMITDSQFDECLLTLLTTGMVYGGPKTVDYPEGCYIISLHQRDEETESTVYSALPMPRVETKQPLPKRVS